MTKSGKKEGGSSSCCCRECCFTARQVEDSISRAKLVELFEAFAKGEWTKFLRASEICNEQAAIARQRQRRRRRGDDLESRVIRAENLVHVGELSSARQALEGDAVAPGTQATLDKLQGVQRRPPQPREALPPEIARFQPPTLFQLDEKQFGRNLRSARRGVAGEPSGVTCEHLRPLLDEGKAMPASFQVGRELGKSSRASGCGVNGEIWTINGSFKTRRRGLEALSVETSFVGWWHERLPNSWEKQLNQPLLPTNTHCRPVQGVSALPMHSRVCAS